MNSFNTSTIGGRFSKTYLKVEGVTFPKKDVLFLCDCRLGRHEQEITKLFGLNRNCSYKTYWNSNNDARGVGVAIKRNIVHTISEMYKSEDQNVILIKMVIKGVQLIVGSIYGPNGQSPEFFRNLRAKLEKWDAPFIIGGDFNTILDCSPGRTGKGWVEHQILRTVKQLENGLIQGIVLNLFVPCIKIAGNFLMYLLEGRVLAVKTIPKIGWIFF